MTTSTDSAPATTGTTIPEPRETEPVFLWGPGYQLTARDVANAIGSYLAQYGDTLGPGGVSVFDAIHAEVTYNGDLTGWTTRKTPKQVATIRARAEQLAREHFRRFPALTW